MMADFDHGEEHVLVASVEKNGGIDSFLLNAFNKNLSSDARKYKKSISKASVQNNSKKD